MGKARARKKGLRKHQLKQFSSLMVKTRSHVDNHRLAEFYNKDLASPVPPTLGVSLEKMKVNQTMEALSVETIRLQCIDRYNYIVIKRGLWEVRLYFTGQKYFFVRISEPLKRRELSCVYMGKAWAMAALRTNAIDYRERENLE